MEDGVDSKKLEGFSLNLSELPEGCIAYIFAFATPSPTDACRLSLISRVCNSAAKSDVIWERFLPSDLDLIIARSEEREALLNEFPTKKQLYMRLVDRPLLIDGATKSFWLDKTCGSKCLMLGARSLSIAWGDTPRYWRWASIPESRFPEVAQLVVVCWLEIRGKIKTSILSPNSYYVAYLVFKTTEGAHGLDVEADSFVNNVRSKPISFVPRPPPVPTYAPPPPHAWYYRRPIYTEYPEDRSDGWKEVFIGDFYVPPGEEAEVELSVLEVRELNWKSGLIVQGIELRLPDYF